MKFSKLKGIAVFFRIVRALLIAVGTIIIILSGPLYNYFWDKYKLPFSAIVYTLTTPLKGTNLSAVNSFKNELILTIFLFIFVFWFYAALSKFFKAVDVDIRLRLFKHNSIIRLGKCYKNLVFIVVMALVGMSFVRMNSDMKIIEYFTTAKAVTSIYDDYYVFPHDVNIEFPENKRNLILIYLESMETAYASKDVGGEQNENNYIPNLTEMAKDNVSFSNKDEGMLGGWRPLSNTGWTMSSLFASSTGLPYTFPLGVNEMAGSFANTETLGDILADNGYINEFMCGSDIAFAGRDKFFVNNGAYRIFDYNTAIEREYISSDYKVWWGFEDAKLYDFAKKELTNLSKEGPFNFTMLTVDTHMPNGYICDLCEEKYDEKAANVVACADRQIEDFIEWCKTQDFYDNTTIVVIGDHPRHDSPLVEGVEYYERTVYDCFINAAPAYSSEAYSNREFSELDIFPTILSSLGVKIEGNRLGLGVDLFSGEETLVDKLGYEILDAETQKESELYRANFY